MILFSSAFVWRNDSFPWFPPRRLVILYLPHDVPALRVAHCNLTATKTPHSVLPCRKSGCARRIPGSINAAKLNPGPNHSQSELIYVEHLK
jgi:hypothetical protein